MAYIAADIIIMYPLFWLKNNRIIPPRSFDKVLNMEMVDCTPRPSSLIESMRNVGYTMETAVADIIDNSIAAQASEIKIFYSCEEGMPCIAILDNGQGMTREELIEAMRPGGFGPLQERLSHDLGRFGLGLKTASFSQSRRLTVATRKQGAELIAACWDLDSMQDCWHLTLLGKEAIVELPWIESFAEHAGTLVLWEKMDRICTSSTNHDTIRDDFLKHIELVRKHLALVFHRFLDDKRNASLNILMNNEPVRYFDPYFRGYPATQILAEEFITVRGSRVSVKPFIIPHYSKMKAADYDTLRELGGPSATQGFYVYRNKRLLAWGDWFRLRKAKTEASGLARVMVDIPNDLDELWSLDIKKSSVSPPEAVKREMMRIIDRITDCSVRTYTSRGQRFTSQKYSPWVREDSNQGVCYRINRQQQIIDAFTRSLPDMSKQEFAAVIDIVERFIPVEAIYNDKLGGNMDSNQLCSPIEKEKHEAIISLLRKQGVSESEIQAIVSALNC